MNYFIAGSGNGTWMQFSWPEFRIKTYFKVRQLNHYALHCRSNLDTAYRNFSQFRLLNSGLSNSDFGFCLPARLAVGQAGRDF